MQVLTFFIDLGIGWYKVTIIDDNENIVGRAQKEYLTSHPQVTSVRTKPRILDYSFCRNINDY